MTIIERLNKAKDITYDIDYQALLDSVIIDIEDTISYIKNLLDDNYSLTQFSREDMKTIIDKLGGDSNGY